MPQATVWVCLYHPAEYSNTKTVAEQVRVAVSNWEAAARDRAALAAAGFELEYDGSEREIIDIAARKELATPKEAIAAADATGVRSRIMDFEDDGLELGCA